VSDYLDEVRRGYEHFARTGDFLDEIFSPDFIWDMSQFRGWPERQTYAGVEGARAFMRDWREAWDEWEIEIEAVHGGGDTVVVIVRQAGRSKTTGLQVDMTFAQNWEMRDGKQVRMTMYADPAEGLKAAGLQLPR
jgi:ketosteroid isomerase-like protein